MKAAIITIVKNAVDESFGPAMQIYAVQKVLEKYGIESETVVDETAKRTTAEKILRGLDELSKGPTAIKFIIQKSLTKSPQKMSEGVNDKQKELIKERRKKYKEFIDKYVVISKLKETSLNEKNIELNAYDYFVVGSDQVWNPYYPQKDSIKYLQFCEKNKRVPFAPSIARNDIPKRFRKSFIKGINGFDQLCIREKEGQEVIKKYTGKNATVVLDPTMMLDSSLYMEMAKKPSCIPETDYSFNYFMGTDTNRDLITSVVKGKVSTQMWMRDFSFPDYYVMNPLEYLYAIKNAEVVCTDSFHVSVFSILLHKPLIVFSKNEGGVASTNSRLKTLLKTFEMEQCEYKTGFEIQDVYNIDYEKVDEILQVQKKNSFDFYDNIFGE